MGNKPILLRLKKLGLDLNAMLWMAGYVGALLAVNALVPAPLKFW